MASSVIQAASTTASATGSATSSATTEIASSSPTANDDGITTGGKIGLGVGIGLAGIALGILLAMVWFKWWQRRRHRRAGWQAPIMNVGTGHVDAEKQYPASRPAAGGMAATITHRGDFEWQNISEAGYDDPQKGPLGLNMNSIGPVGYYGPSSDTASSTKSPPAAEGDHRAFSSHTHLAEHAGQPGTDALPPGYAGGDNAFAHSDQKGFYGSDRPAAAELPTNDSVPRLRPRTAEEAGFELPAETPPAGRHRGRNVDEQKFLLTDLEMLQLRQAKQAKQAKQTTKALSRQQYAEVPTSGDSSPVDNRKSSEQQRTNPDD